MSTKDDQDKRALAQLLMVEITVQLEDLAALAADQQRAKASNPNLVDGVVTVLDLLTAYGHMLARRATSPR